MEPRGWLICDDTGSWRPRDWSSAVLQDCLPAWRLSWWLRENAI